MIPTIEIDECGNITTLYNDEVDLYELGRVHDVHKASNVEFNESQQLWEIIHAKTGKVVGSDKNREEAIKKEIRMFQPGGEYYNA